MAPRSRAAQRRGDVEPLARANRVLRGREQAPDALGDDYRAGRVSIGQDHGELLAPVAGHEVAWSQGGLEAAGHAGQHLVASRVAVGVVYSLEVVDVDHDQRQGTAIVGGKLALGSDDAVEPTPVEETGQGI